MKTGRRRAREFALQGLYQWQLSGTDPAAIARQLGEAKGFGKIDEEYFRDLLEGAVRAATELESQLAPLLDRKFGQLSPVERGILMLSAYELLHRPEVPYRVVINEAVELAKQYGSDSAPRFVNGVLGSLAEHLHEIKQIIQNY